MRRVLGAAVVVVAIVGIGLAALVVVRSTSRIRLEKPPVMLGKPPAEQELAMFKSDIKRRIARLTHRYDKFRSGSRKLTPEQDSLARVCDSGFVRVRADAAVLDTIMVSRRAEELKHVVAQEYKGLLASVTQFTRTFTKVSVPELDSLNLELRKLISE